MYALLLLYAHKNKTYTHIQKFKNACVRVCDVYSRQFGFFQDLVVIIYACAAPFSATAGGYFYWFSIRRGGKGIGAYMLTL